MEKEELLSAGRFAALVGTTKDTLIHYEEIGLFRPKKRGTNGYRYYSADQMETFEVIGMLRELDMPLAEIRSYLDERSPERFAGLLEQEEKIVKEKIRRMREVQHWILEKKKFLQQAMREYEEAKSRDPVCPLLIRNFPRQYLVTNYSEYTDNLAVSEKIGELYEYCAKNGIRSFYNVGFIQRKENLEQKIYLDYHQFYLLFDQPPKKMEYTIRPEGTYLCFYFKGNWENIGEGYEKMLAYAKEENLSCESIFFEDYIQDALTSTTVSEYVTRMAVKLKE